jgi:hypothetical protein
MNTKQTYSTGSFPQTDVWPNGSPAGYTDVWERPTPAQNERERLDNLIGLALVDSSIRDRLMVQHDRSLVDAFNLTDETRQRLSNTRAGSLQELAQSMLGASKPYSSRQSRK